MLLDCTIMGSVPSNVMENDWGWAWIARPHRAWHETLNLESTSYIASPLDLRQHEDCTYFL